MLLLQNRERGSNGLAGAGRANMVGGSGRVRLSKGCTTRQAKPALYTDETSGIIVCHEVLESTDATTVRLSEHRLASVLRSIAFHFLATELVVV